VKATEKEQYLREYEVLKKKGKPFFPYAVAKDSAMALIVVLVIVVMSIVLGAEQGPKVDPTTTTYTPRPEWYFFFLFELLRVLKGPDLVLFATIIIPTICMVLLLLLPFYDRGPERRPERRPVAMTAMVLTIIAMAYLTYEGANTGAPTEIQQSIKASEAAAATQVTPSQFKTLKAGQEVVAQSGCLACHKLGENGNAGPGPTLTHIGARIPRNGILRSLRAGPGIMPAFNDLPPRKLKAIADYLASLH
jgi:menaquinol-cytochrome c reductase cytochrome b/c subunit